MSSTHQLAAIMFTDLVGYTALMGESEEKAFRLLDINRKLQKDQIEKFGGRYLKEMGDGILASFDSASKAVYCSGAIQNAAEKEDGISLRIGIHLGDVVFKEGDVFGDGVNIASRIEQIAEPGGIAVTEPVYRNVKNKEGINARFLREEQLKNVDDPVRIYEVSIGENIAGVPPASSTSKKEKKSITNKLALPLAGVLMITIGYFLYQNFISDNSKTANSDGTYSSIAVLAFEDLSPEGDQEYLGDGIAEEIINVLTRMDGLKVIGRTSSFSFKGKDDDLVSIGSKLGVGTILEGSVRKSDNQIRVTAQLINAQDGSHLWSETYDRELADIFAIQDDISQRIADKFKLTLTLSQEESPPTRNINAYEMYLKGRQYASLGLVGTDKALEYLTNAIQRDPSFLLAYVELPELYWVRGFYGQMDPAIANQKAKRAALKAIEIDSSSYLGYRELSYMNFLVDWEWDSVLYNYNKAVSLGMPVAQSYNAYYQSSFFNNYDSAIRIVKQILDQDPLAVDKLLDLSRMYMYARKYDNVIENGSYILEMSPGNSSIKRHLGIAYLMKGDAIKAEEIFGKLMEIDSTYAPYGYIGALVDLNRKADAAMILENLKPSLPASKIAMSYIHLDEPDSAFKYLDVAFHRKESFLAFITTEPQFQLIEDDPRYKELVERMNFPEPINE